MFIAQASATPRGKRVGAITEVGERVETHVLRVCGANPANIPFFDYLTSLRQKDPCNPSLISDIPAAIRRVFVIHRLFIIADISLFERIKGQFNTSDMSTGRRHDGVSICRLTRCDTPVFFQPNGYGRLRICSFCHGMDLIKLKRAAVESRDLIALNVTSTGPYSPVVVTDFTSPLISELLVSLLGAVCSATTLLDTSFT